MLICGKQQKCWPPIFCQSQEFVYSKIIQFTHQELYPGKTHVHIFHLPHVWFMIADFNKIALLFTILTFAEVNSDP